MLDNFEKKLRDFSPYNLTALVGKLEGLVLTGLLTSGTHETGRQLSQCLHDSSSSQRKDSQLDDHPFSLVFFFSLHVSTTLSLPRLLSY